VTFALISEAEAIGDDVISESFDRLFPNQDELSGRGFGNLIALPFQGKASKHGNTVFLDPETDFQAPYDDQYSVMLNIQRIPESKLEALIDEWNLSADPHKNPVLNGNQERKDIMDRIAKCEFISWCKDEPEKVPEPLWYALISNLSCLRPGGYSLCHEISKGHPGYTREETDFKIHQAMDPSRPHTCEYIRKNGFECRNNCDVKSPVSVIFKYGC
jgi:hypothetical protein